MKPFASRAISLHGLALALALALSFSLPAGAGNTATQRITYSIEEATYISVSGDPTPMRVVAATSGTEPVPVTEASTSYSLAANGGENAKKITAAIDKDLPAGVLLEVQLAPPDGNATSTRQAMSSRATDLVTNIDNVAVTNQPITYTLRADPTAPKLVGETILVTYTITNQI